MADAIYTDNIFGWRKVLFFYIRELDSWNPKSVLNTLNIEEKIDNFISARGEGLPWGRFMRGRFTVCDLRFFDIARDLQNTRAMGHTRPKILMTKTDPGQNSRRIMKCSVPKKSISWWVDCWSVCPQQHEYIVIDVFIHIM